MARWPRRLIRWPTPTAGRGIARTRLLGLMRRWPGELINSAGRALRRGGVAAAAAFWEQAVALTPDPGTRATRALPAAEAKYAAGDFQAAQALLAAAEIGSLSELGAARVQRMRAQVAFALRRGSDAPPLLLRAAQRLQALDAELARQTYLQALVAAIYAGRLAHGEDVREVARAAISAPSGPSGPEPLLVAAWRGDAPAAADLTGAMVRGASARGEGAALTYAEYATAVLGNGLGNYGPAAEAAHNASAAGEVVISPWALYELVEAAVRSDQRERAAAAADRLSGIAAASVSDWAGGAAARSRALLAEGAPPKRSIARPSSC